MTVQELVQPDTGPGGTRSRKVSITSLVPLGVWGLLTLAAIIEILPRTGIVRPQDLPPMSVISGELVNVTQQPWLWQTIYDTLYVWAIGLLVSVVAGVVFGLIIGSSLALRNFTHSTVEFLRPIPSVALIPLVVLLFGTQYESALTLVIYASFWQVLIQTIYGAIDVDAVAMETARSYRFSLLSRVRYVLLPSALPYIMTGVRLAATVALVLTVTAQLIIGTPGIGHRIGLAENAGNVPQTYALVIITGLLGVLINLGVRYLEKSLLSWHTSFRGEVR